MLVEFVDTVVFQNDMSSLHENNVVISRCNTENSENITTNHIRARFSIYPHEHHEMKVNNKFTHLPNSAQSLLCQIHRETFMIAMTSKIHQNVDIVSLLHLDLVVSSH